jgi:hypothetical protein
MTDDLPGLARYIDAVSAPVELREVTNRRRRRGRSRRAVLVALAVAVASTGVALVVRRDSSPGTRVTTRSTVHSSATTAATTSVTTAVTETTVAGEQPVQTGAMPPDAVVAIGPALFVIDTHEPSKRRTHTTFSGDAFIDLVTVDRPHDRVFFGVTSGCDPGINGMYAMPISGGQRRKMAPYGSRVAVSPDGSKIAYSVHTDGCGSRDLAVQDVATGHRQLFSGQRSIHVGAWASDGQSLFFNTEGTPVVYRFRPFDPGARLDDSERWDTGIVSDSGGGRIALLDWCSGTSFGGCTVGVRTRSEDPTGPTYSFGHVNSVEGLSIDSSGMWPLLVIDRPTTGNNSTTIVRLFADGKWRDFVQGNAADW